MTVTPASSTPARTDLVNIVIDGQPVAVPKGTLAIRAAETIGIEIPRFCDHPLLEPVGACRQCLVEVATPGPDGTMRFMPKPQPSCTQVVSEGMEIKTQHSSPVADKAQQAMLEFLLINHPLDCPVCDKGGECPLQNQALSHGSATSRFVDVKRTFTKPYAVSSQVLLDRERCVLCQRCTRFSDQIAGDPFIALVERGADQQIGVYQDQPFSSYFSGNTVQICPVGALTSATYRFRARPFDLRSTPSSCEHCASGCTLRVDHRRNTVTRRMAVNVPETNEEWNCDKGRWAFAYGTLSDRLTTPLVRGEDGELHPASWPEALRAAANGLTAAQRDHGAAVLLGGRHTVEDAYTYSAFARAVLGTNDIDFRARPHSDEEAQFLASSVVTSCPSTGGVTFSRIESASSVLLVGFEPEEESPLIFLRLRKAMRQHRLPVFSIAPFASRGLTKLNGTLIPAAPRTEPEVLQALQESHAEMAEIASAIDANSIIVVGERMASVPGALSAVSALAQQRGASLAWVPRRAGERAALSAGCLPGLLPGGRPVTDPLARTQVESVVGYAVPSQPGRSASEIVEAAAAGSLSGLVVAGLNIGDQLHQEVWVKALENTFVVALDIRHPSTYPYADVIFPVATVAEKSGTFINWEGREVTCNPALRSMALSDHAVIDTLASHMGVQLGAKYSSDVKRQLEELGTWTGSAPSAPQVAAVPVPALGQVQVVLSTWHTLLDAGSLQDGEPHLAGTAKATVAHLSSATAQSVGVTSGDILTVSSTKGEISVPLEVIEMVDYVVWLPTHSHGSLVRTALDAQPGDVVTLSKGGVK